MNPLEQTEQQRQATFQTTGLQPAPQVPTTINAGSLGQTQGLSVAPTVQVPTPTLPILDAPGQLSSFENKVNTAGKKDVALNDAISTATSPFQKQLSDVNSQIGALNARAIQNQEQILRSGGDTSFQSGESQRVARTDAIQGLFLKSQADALQGNIASAESTATRAVNAQFAQKEQDILSARQNIVNNYDSFTSAEKKRANATLLRLDKDDAFVAQEKENRNAVTQIGVKLASFGVDPKIVQEVMKSGNVDEALAKAGTNLRDPKAQLELEKIRLDNVLTKSQIAKSNYEITLLRKYNGMTASAYAANQKEEKKAIKEAKTEAEQARLQGQALNSKVILLDSVLNSGAIDAVVGPSFVSRAATSKKGLFGRFVAGAIPGALAGLPFGGVGAIPGAIIGGVAVSMQGSKDYFSGASDKLVGQTEQFISKEFLQNLIDVKAQGATFGALQKAEQDALTASATFIGQRRIYSGKGEDKQVAGYDMSEADFKRELKNIQDLTRLAHERATGKMFSSEEGAVLDSVYTNTQIDPSNYFNN